MTEEEARKKWCPFARAMDRRIGSGSVGQPNNWVSVNMHEEGPHCDCMCIASACMAWQRLGSTERGYCGLVSVR